MAPRLNKSLRDWCDRNSQPITTYQHLCMKSEKFRRGKKISLNNATVLEHIEILAEPFPDISVNHTRSMEEIVTVKPAALHYQPTDRIIALCIPNYRPTMLPREYTIISPAALEHQITDRENILAIPMKRRNPRPRDFTIVKKSALGYTASARVEELGKPSKRRRGKKWKYQEPVYVKKAALSATASPRTEEMAKPTPHPDTVNRKHPFEVKKSALNYTATARMSIIARPKRTTPKFVNPEYKWKYRFSRDIESTKHNSTQISLKD